MNGLCRRARRTRRCCFGVQRALGRCCGGVLPPLLQSGCIVVGLGKERRDGVKVRVAERRKTWQWEIGQANISFTGSWREVTVTLEARKGVRLRSVEAIGLAIGKATVLRRSRSACEAGRGNLSGSQRPQDG